MHGHSFRCALSWGLPLWLATATATAPVASLARESDAPLAETEIFIEAPEGTPEALYVLSREEIRRSGATTIPELLRRVPGLEVARIDAHTWAVSARGFNHRYASKLAVRIDGRDVRSAFTGGVEWDQLATRVGDIERIEVVRGPGRTSRGTGGMNGVVEIVTRSAEDEQSLSLSSRVGTQTPGSSTLRYGEALGERAHYRVSAHFDKQRPFGDPRRVPESRFIKLAGLDTRPVPDVPAADASSRLTGGFRLDWQASARDRVTLEGEGYRGAAESKRTQDYLHVGWRQPIGTSVLDTFADSARFRGGSFQAQLDHRLSKSAQLSARLDYAHDERTDVFLGQVRDRLEVHLSGELAPFSRERLAWGLATRLDRDSTDSSFELSVIQHRRLAQRVSGFLESDRTLIPGRLHLVTGARLQRNRYSGFEVEPSGRLWWRPHPGVELWGAVSRSVRVPTRMEHDGQIQSIALKLASPSCCLLGRILGNRDLEPQKLDAFEVGGRWRPTPVLRLDVALFENHYHDLFTSIQSPCLGVVFIFCFESSPLGNIAVGTRQIVNGRPARSRGAELSGSWRVSPHLWLWASYRYLQVQFDPGTPKTIQGTVVAGDLSATWPGASSPRHQLRLHTQLDLPHGLELDADVAYVSRLAHTRSAILPQLRAPGYTRVDLRVGWQLRSNVSLALVGQDLQGRRHREFGATEGLFASDVPRRFRLDLQIGF